MCDTAIQAAIASTAAAVTAWAGINIAIEGPG